MPTSVAHDEIIARALPMVRVLAPKDKIHVDMGFSPQSRQLLAG